MREFEAVLDECLRALREGRWDLRECLARYPEHAEALRPYLLVTLRMSDAYGDEPREEFAREARERFRIASGQRIQEAYDVEPEPSFFAATRVRFLMAAHKMRLSRASGNGRRVVPSLQTNMRALAGVAAALVLFLGFSTYTVASASGSLPGDWQYPVKLQTERVRLALTFSEEAERGVRLDIASERAAEIQKLAERGRIIGPGVINRLVSHTESLVRDAGERGDEWDSHALERLHAVAQHEKQVLERARPQIDPAAEELVAQAAEISRQGVSVSNQILARRPDAPARLVTPSVPLEALDDPGDSTPTPGAPTPEPTPDESATPDDTSTPRSTPTTERVRPEPDTINVDETPVGTRGGVSWIRLAVGGFTTLVPSSEDGWRIVNINPAAGEQPAPTLVKLANYDSTSLITINPRNGDMYWYIVRNGRFDELHMRMRQPDGTTLIVDDDYVRDIYGDAAEIPLYVLENIEFMPRITPTAEPSPTGVTPEVSPTAP